MTVPVCLSVPALPQNRAELLAEIDPDLLIVFPQDFAPDPRDKASERIHEPRLDAIVYPLQKARPRGRG
jgi:hypothetical protein